MQLSLEPVFLAAPNLGYVSPLELAITTSTTPLISETTFTGFLLAVLPISSTA
ncbi:hypothetical protein AB6E04_13555 [Vibrio amylolyticus]|uniref:hypothetical protein n=1 Tax=Vibrio amylolyticus TaxID=2847292 RepID=UPI0035523533